MYTDLIKLIKCFPDNSKLFWIKNLYIPDSVKGYLIIYFNLL